MKLSHKIILAIFALFLAWIFYWAIFAEKQDISEKIEETLKEQEKVADLAFKDVSFEEIAEGTKYWQLKAAKASINKSTELASLRKVKGTFFKKGEAVLKFISPAALWQMKDKEILLDHAIGYDVSLEKKISALMKNKKNLLNTIFNLPKQYKNGEGYWFEAKNLNWKLATQKLLCSGGIVLNKGEVVGIARQLEADVALEKIKLFGSPKVTISPPKLSPATIEAEVFEVVSSQDLIVAKGSPRLVWNEAQVIAQEIQYIQRKEQISFTDGVKITYRDIEAIGNSAIYETANEKIILTGKAKASQADNTLTGEKVQVSLRDNKISVIGQGKVIISEEELEQE